MDLLDKVTLEHLDEEDTFLANLIGLDNFVALIKNYGGSFIYVKKEDTVTKNVRDEEIRNKFKGANYYELAVEYSLSEKMIRNIVSDDYMKKNQLSIFDT